MTDLDRYEPPDVPLRLTRGGPGSRASIVEYVERVLRERTTPNPDTSVERLAAGLTTAILSRLGAGYSIAIGQAWIGLVPVASYEEAVDGRIGDDKAHAP